MYLRYKCNSVKLCFSALLGSECGAAESGYVKRPVATKCLLSLRLRHVTRLDVLHVLKSLGYHISHKMVRVSYSAKKCPSSNQVSSLNAQVGDISPLPALAPVPRPHGYELRRWILRKCCLLAPFACAFVRAGLGSGWGVWSAVCGRGHVIRSGLRRHILGFGVLEVFQEGMWAELRRRSGREVVWVVVVWCLAYFMLGSLRWVWGCFWIRCLFTTALGLFCEFVMLLELLIVLRVQCNVFNGSCLYPYIILNGVVWEGVISVCLSDSHVFSPWAGGIWVVGFNFAGLKHKVRVVSSCWH